jgi:hypothetical protein
MQGSQWVRYSSGGTTVPNPLMDVQEAGHMAHTHSQSRIRALRQFVCHTHELAHRVAGSRLGTLSPLVDARIAAGGPEGMPIRLTLGGGRPCLRASPLHAASPTTLLPRRLHSPLLRCTASLGQEHQNDASCSMTTHGRTHSSPLPANRGNHLGPPIKPTWLCQ